MVEEGDVYGDVVVLPFADQYDVVVLKTVAICQQGMRFNASYVLKVDDDTFVRVNKIIDLMVRKRRVGRGLYLGNLNIKHPPLRHGKWRVTHEVGKGWGGVGEVGTHVLTWCLDVVGMVQRCVSRVRQQTMLRHQR